VATGPAFVLWRGVFARNCRPSLRPATQAFDLQLLYNKEKNQVTIYATITTSTPHTVAAIINDSEPPNPTSPLPFPTSR
jgi:hypothetical protein